MDRKSQLTSKEKTHASKRSKKTKMAPTSDKENIYKGKAVDVKCEPSSKEKLRKSSSLCSSVINSSLYCEGTSPSSDDDSDREISESLRERDEFLELIDFQILERMRSKTPEVRTTPIPDNNVYNSASWGNNEELKEGSDHDGITQLVSSKRHNKDKLKNKKSKHGHARKMLIKMLTLLDLDDVLDKFSHRGVPLKKPELELSDRIDEEIYTISNTTNAQREKEEELVYKDFRDIPESKIESSLSISHNIKDGDESRGINRENFKMSYRENKKDSNQVSCDVHCMPPSSFDLLMHPFPYPGQQKPVFAFLSGYMEEGVIRDTFKRIDEKFTLGKNTIDEQIDLNCEKFHHCWEPIECKHHNSFEKTEKEQEENEGLIGTVSVVSLEETRKSSEKELYCENDEVVPLVNREITKELKEEIDVNFSICLEKRKKENALKNPRDYRYLTNINDIATNDFVFHNRQLKIEEVEREQQLLKEVPKVQGIVIKKGRKIKTKTSKKKNCPAKLETKRWKNSLEEKINNSPNKLIENLKPNLRQKRYKPSVSLKQSAISNASNTRLFVSCAFSEHNYVQFIKRKKRRRRVKSTMKTRDEIRKIEKITESVVDMELKFTGIDTQSTSQRTIPFSFHHFKRCDETEIDPKDGLSKNVVIDDQDRMTGTEFIYDPHLHFTVNSSISNFSVDVYTS